jgi:Tfp pilus assembly pilus retraction ATPase PilT
MGNICNGRLARTHNFRLTRFINVGLPFTSSDRRVWEFAQTHGLILLTGNRNMVGSTSLEQTIREANHTAALPVITIGSVDRLIEYEYRQRCATRLAEIGLYLTDYLGTGRLFIP